MAAEEAVVVLPPVVQAAEGEAPAQVLGGSASSLVFAAAQPGLVASGVQSQPVCALAKRICKPRATGNSVKDNAQNTEYGLYVQCVNLLDAHPKVRQECAGFLVQALNEKRKDDETKNGFFEEVSSLGKLPECFVVAWVCKHTGFTASDLGRAKVQNKEILGHIMEFLLCATKTLKVPEAMRSKLVAYKTLDMRLEEAGNRHLLVLNHALIKNGKVNYLMFAYKLVLEGDLVKKVVHRPTKAEAIVPADVRIDKEFELCANHSDMGAYVCKGVHHCIYLYKFFDKDQGPNSVKVIHGLNKNFNGLAKTASQTSEAALKEAVGHAAGYAAGPPVLDEAYNSPSKEVLRERLTKARAECQKRGEASAKKRRTSLTERLSID